LLAQEETFEKIRSFVDHLIQANIFVRSSSFVSSLSRSCLFLNSKKNDHGQPRPPFPKQQNHFSGAKYNNKNLSSSSITPSHYPRFQFEDRMDILL